MKNVGKFVVSLDFELMWGVRDKKSIDQYGENILGVHKVIPRLLDIFSEFEIRATFATVGFLFFDSKQKLLSSIPSMIPNYDNTNLSPYGEYLNGIDDVINGNYHFAPKLIKLINDQGSQEIGTHTFSHYYCLEPGQNLHSFRSDLENAVSISLAKGIKIKSLIFPRNQFNEEYLKICSEFGILCYRGNEKSWMYEAKNGKEETLFRRFFRLIDAYVNISGHNCYSDFYFQNKSIIDIPSSRFLRPYSKSLRLLDWLRLNRIKSGMSYAAKNKKTYHLWWHPHNFGINQDENFYFLREILRHYQKLKMKHNFRSSTMSELAEYFLNHE